MNTSNLLLYSEKKEQVHVSGVHVQCADMGTVSLGTERGSVITRVRRQQLEEDEVLWK